MIEVPIEKLQTESSMSPLELIQWFEEEKSHVWQRFGDDFPDDYYEKMELWWNSPRRVLEPIEVIHIKASDKYVITDGHHRYAISIKYNHLVVPIVIEEVI